MGHTTEIFCEICFHNLYFWYILAKIIALANKVPYSVFEKYKLFVTMLHNLSHQSSKLVTVQSFLKHAKVFYLYSNIP